ncbi:TPA: hypothetical protein I7682_18075 [Vibrio vulnificus]|nr:hypothetical protein [Vibrio vulnificus]
MQVTIITETRDCESELIRSKIEHPNFTARELADYLKYELVCCTLSSWPICLDEIGADLTNIYLSEDISDDRECIEKGFVKTRSFHYHKGQSSKNVKYWRRLLVALENEDRLIH